MSIYHLHIPRTSGIYVKNNIIPHLITNNIKHFVSNRTIIDKNKISESYFVGGHFGLMPLNYMDNPEVFCIIRNPIDRFISYFNYTTAGQVRSNNDYIDKLEEWLYGEQADIQSNSQSKFLTGSLNIDKFNKNIRVFQEAVKHNWFIEDYSLNLDKILENVDRFFCYSMDRSNEFTEDLNKALFKFFNFQTFKYKDKANASIDLGIKIDKKHYDRILELNEIDMEVYRYVQKSKKRY